MATEGDAGHDAGAEADESVITQVDGAFGLEGLLHDEAGFGVKAVRVVSDVDLFAEDAAVTDGDGVNGEDMGVIADVDVVTDFDAGSIVEAGMRVDGFHAAESSNGGASADGDVAGPGKVAGVPDDGTGSE